MRVSGCGGSSGGGGGGGKGLVGESSNWQRWGRIADDETLKTSYLYVRSHQLCGKPKRIRSYPRDRTVFCSVTHVTKFIHFEQSFSRQSSFLLPPPPPRTCKYANMHRLCKAEGREPRIRRAPKRKMHTVRVTNRHHPQTSSLFRHSTPPTPPFQLPSYSSTPPSPSLPLPLPPSSLPPKTA